MAFFTQELAIDLGTANTVIFKDGEVVLDELLLNTTMGLCIG